MSLYEFVGAHTTLKSDVRFLQQGQLGLGETWKRVGSSMTHSVPFLCHIEIAPAKHRDEVVCMKS